MKEVTGADLNRPLDEVAGTGTPHIMLTLEEQNATHDQNDDGFIPWLCEQVSKMTHAELLAEVTKFPDMAADNIERLCAALRKRD